MAVAERAHQTNTQFVCVIRTAVGQHFNAYRASRGSLGDSGGSCFNSSGSIDME